jgi:hypothetical protein
MEIEALAGFSSKSLDSTETLAGFSLTSPSYTEAVAGFSSKSLDNTEALAGFSLTSPNNTEAAAGFSSKNPDSSAATVAAFFAVNQSNNVEYHHPMRSHCMDTRMRQGITLPIAALIYSLHPALFRIR